MSVQAYDQMAISSPTLECSQLASNCGCGRVAGQLEPKRATGIPVGGKVL